MRRYAMICLMASAALPYGDVSGYEMYSHYRLSYVAFGESVLVQPECLAELGLSPWSSCQ